MASVSWRDCDSPSSGRSHFLLHFLFGLKFHLMEQRIYVRLRGRRSVAGLMSGRRRRRVGRRVAVLWLLLLVSLWWPTISWESSRRCVWIRWRIERFGGLGHGLPALLDGPNTNQDDSFWSMESVDPSRHSVERECSMKSSLDWKRSLEDQSKLESTSACVR